MTIQIFVDSWLNKWKEDHLISCESPDRGVNGDEWVGTVSFGWSTWDQTTSILIQKQARRKKEKSQFQRGLRVLFFVSFSRIKTMEVLFARSQLISNLCHPNNYPIRVNDTNVITTLTHTHKHTHVTETREWEWNLITLEDSKPRMAILELGLKLKSKVKRCQAKPKSLYFRFQDWTSSWNSFEKKKKWRTSVGWLRFITL